MANKKYQKTVEKVVKFSEMLKAQQSRDSREKIFKQIVDSTKKFSDEEKNDIFHHIALKFEESSRFWQGLILEEGRKLDKIWEQIRKIQSLPDEVILSEPDIKMQLDDLILEAELVGDNKLNFQSQRSAIRIMRIRLRAIIMLKDTDPIKVMTNFRRDLEKEAEVTNAKRERFKSHILGFRTDKIEEFKKKAINKEKVDEILRESETTEETEDQNEQVRRIREQMIE